MPAMRSSGRFDGLESLDHELRFAQGQEMAAVDLVGLDAESFTGDAPLEFGREEPVVTTDEDPRRHLRPSVEGPGLGHRGPGLLRLLMSKRFLTDLRGDIMEVDEVIIVGVLR